MNWYLMKILSRPIWNGLISHEKSLYIIWCVDEDLFYGTINFIILLNVLFSTPLWELFLYREYCFQCLITGPRQMVYVGNKLVDYDGNFKIFLTTRSLTMKQRAAVPGFISIVNFSPTVEGLTQQVLNLCFLAAILSCSLEFSECQPFSCWFHGPMFVR